MGGLIGMICKNSASILVRTFALSSFFKENINTEHLVFRNHIFKGGGL